MTEEINITYQEETYAAHSGETILDCLLRNHVKIPHSCKNAICQSCILKVKKGDIDPQAQKGLRKDQIEQGLIFSCKGKATRGMQLIPALEGDNEVGGVIVRQDRLTKTVVEIELALDGPFKFKAGQFINLIREDGLCRSYSVANLPGEGKITIHVRKIPQGKMSQWLYQEDLVGKETRMTIRGPVGSCYYQPEFNQKDLWLAGTGTGLAPLLGILQDSLARGHQGQITLLHGALNEEGLYHVEKLKDLEERFKNFHYLPCVVEGDLEKFLVGNIINLVASLDIDPQNSVSFICGDPMIVKNLKQTVFLKGLPSRMIFSDPFVAAATP